MCYERPLDANERANVDTSLTRSVLSMEIGYRWDCFNMGTINYEAHTGVYRQDTWTIAYKIRDLNAQLLHLNLPNINIRSIDIKNDWSDLEKEKQERIRKSKKIYTSHRTHRGDGHTILTAPTACIHLQY